LGVRIVHVIAAQKLDPRLAAVGEPDDDQRLHQSFDGFLDTTRIYDHRRTRPEDSPTFKVAY
jgi:hypothetical protein